MGNSPGSHKSKKPAVLTNNNLNTDVFDTKWIEAFENSFVFVWCDGSIGTQSNVDDYINTIKQLARVVNPNRQLVHTFNEACACRRFIQDLDNVCLIVSGTIGQDLVPIIHNLDQIHSIYVFCINKDKHRLWASHYRKVRGVFTDINQICDSLKTYVTTRSSIEYDRLEFDLISNENDLSTSDNSSLCLIYSDLNRMILLNIDSPDDGLDTMISYCRSEYTDEHQTELINSFKQHYAEYSPIWWYTKSYFFQGILNRALRTNDLYTLYSMHQFIQDLDTKLLELNETQRSPNQTLHLFFGQFLSKNDFDRIKQNIGGFMSISQYVSANPELSIAVMYIEQNKDSVPNSQTVRVVFQIDIDQTAESIVSYANIGNVSQFVHEKEHLISMFSVYRIIKIEKLINASSAWLVHVALIDKNDEQYNSLIQNVNLENIDQYSLTQVAYTIKNQSNIFKSANKLFKQALKDNSRALRAIILRYNMALIYDSLGEYAKSIDDFEEVRKMARLYIPECDKKDDICLVPFYSNKARVYEKLNQFPHAFTHAFRALQIVANLPNEDLLKKELESSCYVNLGLIHYQEERLTEARTFYEKAFRIRQGYLPSTHPDLMSLKNILSILPENLAEAF